MAFILGFVGVALIVAADKITKILAYEHLRPRVRVPLIDGFFSLHYSTNDGAAWGILGGQWVLLSIFSTVISAVLVYFYIRLPKYIEEGRVRTIIRAAIVMITGGAIGNLIDRVRPPHRVIDFFSFELINFPIFNIADIFIVCGAIMLCVMLVFFVKDSPKVTKTANEGNEENVENFENV